MLLGACGRRGCSVGVGYWTVAVDADKGLPPTQFTSSLTGRRACPRLGLLAARQGPTPCRRAQPLGQGANQFAPFDSRTYRTPPPASACHCASCPADGSEDNYWHKRANGTEAHAMLVEELVPLLTRRLGALPFALRVYSMGYGALLTAELGGIDKRGRFLQGRRCFQPSLVDRTGPDRAGSVRKRPGLYANDVFTGVAASRSLQVRLDCGELDRFYQATRGFSALMTWPHVAVFRL